MRKLTCFICRLKYVNLFYWDPHIKELTWKFALYELLNSNKPVRQKRLAWKQYEQCRIQINIQIWLCSCFRRRIYCLILLIIKKRFYLSTRNLQHSYKVRVWLFKNENYKLLWKDANLCLLQARLCYIKGTQLPALALNVGIGYKLWDAESSNE